MNQEECSNQLLLQSFSKLLSTHFYSPLPANYCPVLKMFALNGLQHVCYSLGNRYMFFIHMRGKTPLTP